jgi:hypothetical protein
MKTFMYLFRFSAGLVSRPGEVSAPLLDLTSPPFARSTNINGLAPWKRARIYRFFEKIFEIGFVQAVSKDP